MLNLHSPDLLQIRDTTCPACGHHVATTFFAGGRQTLATLAWPDSEQAARNMERLPLDFVRCVDCGHVFNIAFDYPAVPYSDKPNLMFNRGKIWASYIQSVQQEIVRLLPDAPRVVEIGYGDGSFLSALAQLRPDGTFVGFDPNGASSSIRGSIRFRQELFDPAVHLAELRPDLIISRHVLEHLTNPLGFLQSINYAAGLLRLQPHMYFEVPCIDQAIETLRTVDFYYEHSSQFTSASFRRMLERSGASVERMGCGYGREVVYGFVRAAANPHQVTMATEAELFHQAAESARATIALQLSSLVVSGKTTAIWGGTGKSAAFINRYKLDAYRFPVVVDSDRNKVGTFVPGTGQVIRERDWLLSHPAQVILIPPQWRAADILTEIASAGIQFETALIEHRGQLIDYLREEHPYDRPAAFTEAASGQPVSTSV